MMIGYSETQLINGAETGILKGLETLRKKGMAPELEILYRDLMEMAARITAVILSHNNDQVTRDLVRLGLIPEAELPGPPPVLQ